MREQLGLASVQFIDVFSVIENLGVGLQLKGVEPETLDGLAVWGRKHGPAVLLNSDSKRVAGRGDLRRSWAARITLAHELCHLLVDRGHALSAVDILNSRMPLDAERRAKAFAGELLLPGRVAADIWERSNHPRSKEDLTAFLANLGTRYGVPRSVAAWKLEHGLHDRDIDLRAILDIVAPNR